MVTHKRPTGKRLDEASKGKPLARVWASEADGSLDVQVTVPEPAVFKAVANKLRSQLGGYGDVKVVGTTKVTLTGWSGDPADIELAVGVAEQALADALKSAGYETFWGSGRMPAGANFGFDVVGKKRKNVAEESKQPKRLVESLSPAAESIMQKLKLGDGLALVNNNPANVDAVVELQVAGVVGQRVMNRGKTLGITTVEFERDEDDDVEYVMTGQRPRRTEAKRLTGRQLKSLIESVIFEAVPWQDPNTDSYARVQIAAEECVKHASALMRSYEELIGNIVGSARGEFHDLTDDLLDELDPELDEKLSELVRQLKAVQQRLDMSAEEETSRP